MKSETEARNKEYILNHENKYQKTGFSNMAITKQTDLEVDQIGVRVRWGGDGVSMQGGAAVHGGRRRVATEGQSEVRSR